MNTPPTPRERLLARLEQIREELAEVALLRPRLALNPDRYADRLRGEQAEIERQLEKLPHDRLP